MVLVILLLAILIIFMMYAGPTSERMAHKPGCVYLHSEDGLNYPWLDDIHGGLDHITFEEPVGSGKIRPYTDKIWKIHCDVVSHSPDNLAQEHIKAFINPDTRFARLYFHFKDGTVMEPTPEFYYKEAEYFRSSQM